MTRDRIEIIKELIPYRFNIALPDEVFSLEVSYNKQHDFFTIALYKDNELVCASEPIVYGAPLWNDVYTSDKFPPLTIIPHDESGENNVVNWSNFGETVFLEIFDTGEEADE